MVSAVHQRSEVPAGVQVEGEEQSPALAQIGESKGMEVALFQDTWKDGGPPTWERVSPREKRKLTPAATFRVPARLFSSRKPQSGPLLSKMTPPLVGPDEKPQAFPGSPRKKGRWRVKGGAQNESDEALLEALMLDQGAGRLEKLVYSRHASMMRDPSRKIPILGPFSPRVATKPPASFLLSTSRDQLISSSFRSSSLSRSISPKSPAAVSSAESKFAFLAARGSSQSSLEPLEEGTATVADEAIPLVDRLEREELWRSLYDSLVFKELYLGEKIAEGTFGRLYRGMYQGQEVAIKILRVGNTEEEKLRIEGQFRQEVSILSRLDHRNIVKFIGAHNEAPLRCIAMELLRGQSLRTRLHRRFQEQGMPTLLSIIDMALDVAHAMEYLHAKGIIHRDLKSDNLVFEAEDSNTLKLIDFGEAIDSRAHEGPIKGERGTYRWMAPEVLRNEEYDHKADVFSFGIVLWELLTAKVPYLGLTGFQAAYAVVTKDERPKVPSDCPYLLADIMTRCWAADPRKRPEFSQVVKELLIAQGSTNEDEVYDWCRHCSDKCCARSNWSCLPCNSRPYVNA